MNARAPFPALDLSEATEVFPLDALYLSDINPRQEADEDGIAALAQSLIACGLIQNLSGLRDAEGKIAIVAGGRRLRALQIAVAERPDLAQVPVKIAPDEQTAVAWAAAENVARRDMEPAQEISAYDRMHKTGSTLSQIAAAFGVSEQRVRQRLKLANLPTSVLAALAGKKLSLAQAAAFTVGEDPALIEEVLDFAIRQSWSATPENIKARLHPKAGPPRTAARSMSPPRPTRRRAA
ncbi:ParB/RepB/Spo0J family partition protein [Pseudooceanicola sp. CBS1P-1]|uniref:ParB/RepB/Spo0J family partition protein n=1 Tax=Pseudooceanicola albus TaxID=2692189 RepID=A0A6L7GCN8_9RHOB|nr:MULTISPECIES: ParB/RepB/Spo0J family partition protein [Pseudooceanicola]MBT9386874.1 ParB/RepB/Spo0J family partition protein [Pseudooceanicola endophyticus]MXN20990.1 ParB/RepB/Spo0J family partition protein [Pseudooceanicola albus]